MTLSILKIIRFFGVGIGIVGILFLYKQWIFEYIKFRDYLFTINDSDTLRLIGGIREGKKIIGSMSTLKAHGRLKSRYLETGDKYYYLFDKYMIRHFKITFFIFFITFMFFAITTVVQELFLFPPN
jgi:hypothetical protein